MAAAELPRCASPELTSALRRVVGRIVMMKQPDSGDVFPHEDDFLSIFVQNVIAQGFKKIFAIAHYDSLKK